MDKKAKNSDEYLCQFRIFKNGENSSEKFNADVSFSGDRCQFFKEETVGFLKIDHTSYE